MDFIFHFIPENILQALGWTVVHSLWQAFIIALLLSAYLLATKSSSTNRYIAGFVALGSTFVASIATFLILIKQESLGSGSEVWAADGTLLGVHFFEEKQSAFEYWFNTNMPLIVTAWLLGMVGFVLKLCGGLLYIQRLKTRRLLEVPNEWIVQLQKVQQQLGINKTILLRTSALVKTPMMVGWLKPIVLMPVAAVNNLSIQQVEAILAHELAHIARHDYILNILQSLVEALFYFNPSIWWISSRIRTERENCCDDLAVQICGNSIEYAKTLVSLQEMQYASPMLALGFSKNKHQLLHRIKRILQSPEKKSNVMEKISATLLLLAAVVMLSMKANKEFDTNRDFSLANQFELLTANFGEPIFSNEQDTIPANNWHFRQNSPDQDVEIRMKDGKVTYLEIDGEVIEESEYSKYDALIEELSNATPPPPPAPLPPNAPFPPAAPAPPAPAAAPAPPTPPTPPAPISRVRTITTQKGKKGTTIIIETEPGQEPVEIEIENSKKGNITINGNEIKGLKSGDETVIVETLERDAPHRFYLDGNNSRIFTLLEDMPEINAVPLLELAEPLALLEDKGYVLKKDGNLFFKDDDELLRLYDEEQMEKFQKQFFEIQKMKEKEMKELLKDRELKHELFFERNNERVERAQREREELMRERIRNNDAFQRDREDRVLRMQESEILLENRINEMAEAMQLLQEQQESLLQSQSKIDQEEAQRIAKELAKKAEAMQKIQQETMRRFELDMDRKSRRAQ